MLGPVSERRHLTKDEQRGGRGVPRLWLAVLAVVVLMASCGSDDDGATQAGTDATAAPTTSGSSTDASTTTQPADAAPPDACTTDPDASAPPGSGDDDTTTAPDPSSTGGQTGQTTTSASATSTTGASSTAAATSTSTSATATTVSDPTVRAHQEKLSALGYWLGAIDGQLGSMTAHAVTAFQKAEGLPRTGQLDAATVARLDGAATPAARSTSGTVLEIDLARQILLVASGGRVTRIYDIATGAAATPTPAGQFEIYREIDGYRYAPLGTLYRPKYFNGGIALHGYTSVPPQPASHGCVRLTYAAIDDLWASGMAPVGTPVWVY
jgi:peptidoglycan hydrolase-like protein with peptidoglycan-binding domain